MAARVSLNLIEKLFLGLVRLPTYWGQDYVELSEYLGRRFEVALARPFSPQQETVPCICSNVGIRP